MKSIRVLLLLFVLGLVVASCETDFPITGEYEDITIVYGLLDPSSDEQYLKINKAFLGEGSAIDFAGQADSNQYADILEVVVRGFERNGSQINYVDGQEYYFDTTLIHDKDTGLFFAPTAILYKAAMDLDEDLEYELEITNTKSGKKIASSTSLVHDFRIIKPLPTFNPIVRFTADVATVFECSKAQNSNRYEMSARIYYREYEVNDGPEDFEIRMHNWKMGTVKTNPNLHKSVKLDVKGDRFYTFMNNRVPYEDVEKEKTIDYRILDSLVLEVYAAGTDLNTYLDVNGVGSSLVEEKPLFTNIENGYGLFSSRMVKYQKYRFHGETLFDLSRMDLKFVH